MKMFLLTVMASLSISAFAGSIENCVTEANIAMFESVAKSNALTEEQEADFLFTTLDVFMSNTEADSKFTSVAYELCTVLDLAAKSAK